MFLSFVNMQAYQIPLNLYNTLEYRAIFLKQFMAALGDKIFKFHGNTENFFL